ncbi:hypothetical protein VPH35_101884 [Triticum aestivum]
MEQTAVVVAGEAPASSADYDWTQLPADLLIRIFGTLQIPDLFSSGGVCSSWRRSHLEARRFRLCSPHESPCLVYPAADPLPRHSPGPMHNVHLRYGDEDRKLDGYDLIYYDTVPRKFHKEIKPYGILLEQARFFFYMIVAMSCYPFSKNCVVVRVHMPNQMLSYARVGDAKWTWIDTHRECKHYVDALQGCGDVHTIDLHGPSALVNIVYKHKGDYNTDSKYIVHAPWGDIFQIWRWDRYLEDDEEEEEEKERVTARFVVYKIDFVKQNLTKVHNLKDHTLFTGFNTSFLVPAKDFPTLIPNSLRQVLIFNMEDSSIMNILAPNSSRLNWPPPVWIQP